VPKTKGRARQGAKKSEDVTAGVEELPTAFDAVRQDAGWAHLEQRPVEAAVDAAPPRTDYIAERFRPPDPNSFSTHPPTTTLVAAHVRWAAAELVRQFHPVSEGVPAVPRKGARRNTVQDPRTLISAQETETRGRKVMRAEGRRAYTRLDEAALLGAYKAWAGVAVENAWELIVEEEIRDALLEAQFDRITPGEAQLPNGRTVQIPKPILPSARDVLTCIRTRCPPATLPTYINEDVIKNGLEHTTDARGGGRGEQATKKSIRQWLKSVKERARKPR
jgi:hypothetical protein